MHIRTITVVILYICIFLQVLMWVFFRIKCVKLSTFCILQIFATIDVVALMISTQDWLKKRKKKVHKKHQLIQLYILWEPKMCRLARQLLGLLGNVLGLLGMFRNVLGMPWQGPRHACNVLGLLGMLPARS